jgi:hypothetical protein
MPHRKIIRDAFCPEYIDVAVKAYDRVLEFLAASGDAEGDPNVKENLAAQIIAAGHESPSFSFVDIANRAISRYRVQQATMMVATARKQRLTGEKS